VQILNVLLAPGCDPDAECDYKANCEELGFYIDARGVSDYSISKYVALDATRDPPCDGRYRLRAAIGDNSE